MDTGVNLPLAVRAHLTVHDKHRLAAQNSSTDPPLGQTGRGWYYECNCGKSWRG